MMKYRPAFAASPTLTYVPVSYGTSVTSDLVAGAAVPAQAQAGQPAQSAAVPAVPGEARLTQMELQLQKLQARLDALKVRN